MDFFLESMTWTPDTNDDAELDHLAIYGPRESGGAWVGIAPWLKGDLIWLRVSGWPDALEWQPWRVTLWLQPEGVGRGSTISNPGRVDIRTKDGQPTRWPSDLWRALSVQSISEQLPAVLAEARNVAKRYRHLFGPEVFALVDATASEFAKTPHPGKLGRPDVFYAEWAARIEKVGGHTPTRTVAEQYNIRPSTLAHFLQVAKQRGLYKPKGQGKPGGVLTAQGRKVLSVATKKGQ